MLIFRIRGSLTGRKQRDEVYRSDLSLSARMRCICPNSGQSSRRIPWTGNHQGLFGQPMPGTNMLKLLGLTHTVRYFILFMEDEKNQLAKQLDDCATNLMRLRNAELANLAEAFKLRESELLRAAARLKRDLRKLESYAEIIDTVCLAMGTITETVKLLA